MIQKLHSKRSLWIGRSKHVLGYFGDDQKSYPLEQEPVEEGCMFM